jgi:hypothetical protein
MTDRQKRKEAIAQANNTCPKCGAVHGQTIRTSERTGNLWVTYLQLAHPDHNPWDPEAKTEVLCNGCHMGKDGPMHAASARRTHELRKNGKGKRYQRNYVSNQELARIANLLGVDMAYEPDEQGGTWHWRSEISAGSHREMACAFDQALYDLVATYRDLAHRYAPEDEFHQDKIATLCAVGGGEHETTGG